MTYTLKLSSKEMLSLLDVIKTDFEFCYNDGDDSKVAGMEEDIQLLKSIADAFNDESAKMKLLTVISGYERKLRSVK